MLKHRFVYKDLDIREFSQQLAYLLYSSDA